jgi:hypothetical protein
MKRNNSAVECVSGEVSHDEKKIRDGRRVFVCPKPTRKQQAKQGGQTKSRNARDHEGVSITTSKSRVCSGKNAGTPAQAGISRNLLAQY